MTVETKETTHGDTLYQFDQLDETAKERARDWLRYVDGSYGDFYEEVINDADVCARLLGIALDGRLSSKRTVQETRNAVFYSVSHSQSDYVTFTGTWKDEPPEREDVASKVAKKLNGIPQYYTSFLEAISEYAPKDEALHAIATILDGVRTNTVGAITCKITEADKALVLEATAKEVLRLGDTNTVVRVTEVEASMNTIHALHDALNKFASWILEQLRSTLLYHYSAEYVDECIRANEYTFTEDGERSDG